MGFLDFIILGGTGTIFTVTLIAFLFSMSSTDEPILKKAKMNTYVPILTMCSIVFILYVFAVSISKMV